MPHLRGLIFDLDGTLIDSAGDLRAAVNTVLAAQGRRALTLNEIKRIVGDGMRVMLQRAFALTGAPLPDAQERVVMDDLLRVYQILPASTDMIYPQAVETIIACRGRGIKIGLCTNKLYMPTMKVLGAIGITDLFDFVAGSDTFPVFKPDPGHVLGVANALQCPPQHCVMIGDSANDIDAARAVPMVSIAVAHGYGRGIAALGADAVIGGFAELPDALRHLGFDSGA